MTEEHTGDLSPALNAEDAIKYSERIKAEITNQCVSDQNNADISSASLHRGSLVIFRRGLSVREEQGEGLAS